MKTETSMTAVYDVENMSTKHFPLYPYSKLVALSRTDIVISLLQKKIQSQKNYVLVEMLKVTEPSNPSVKNYSSMTITLPGEVVGSSEFWETVKNPLCLKQTLQIICNFIQQSGSLIPFLNHSSLQSFLKIELINIATKIAEQVRFRLQSGDGKGTLLDQVLDPECINTSIQLNFKKRTTKFIMWEV